jgi:hypothetical protein
MGHYRRGGKNPSMATSPERIHGRGARPFRRGLAMKRGKNWAVAVAVGMPLAAVGYLVWVYYSTKAELARQSLLGTTSDPNAPTLKKWDFSPVDPADLHGTWTSRAELGSGANLNRRESELNFEPGGRLVWTSRTTVGTLPPIEIVEKYDYKYDTGPVLTLSPTERSFDGKRFELQGNALPPKFWRLKWTADDKTSFQLLTDPNDPGRSHLLFRRTGAAGKGWRLFGWDLAPPASRSATDVKLPARP